MKIVIASQSPVKIAAVKRGFATIFPQITPTFVAVPAKSGVSNQPMSLEEIRHGAWGRLKDAKSMVPAADFYSSLEGGVHLIDDDLFNLGWVVIDDGKKRGQAQALGFALPATVRNLINSGMEMSHAVDQVLATTNSKLGTGTIGPLTNNAITYADWYTQAVIAALIPFANPELYPSMM